MAPGRQTRSRGTAALATGLPDSKETLETPRNKVAQHPSPKGKKSAKASPYKTRTNGTTSNGTNDVDDSESVGEEDDGESFDDAEDGLAPPRISTKDRQADDRNDGDSSAVQTPIDADNKSWVGSDMNQKKTTQLGNDHGPNAVGFGEDFYSDAEGNADEEEDEDAEFDVADDDDNYDDVDKISDTSDASDAFEREVEREILAAGEENIDWDDVNTYGYDQTPNVNQYSMTIDLGLEHDSPLHPELAYFEDLRTPMVSSPTLSRDLSQQFGAALRNHRRRHTFDSVTNSDSSDSSSSSSAAEQVNDDTVTSSSSDSVSADDDASEDAGATTDEDEDPSDYEAVRPRVTPAVATPPTWIPNFPSLTSGPKHGRIPSRSNRANGGHHRSSSSTQARPLVLRKLRLPSHKAVVQHVRTARGWTVRFELRGGHSLRWMSSPSSAASTPVTRARNSFDLDSTADRYISRAGFDDVLQGRLFQHRYCTPRNPQHHTPNFSRGYDLFSANALWAPHPLDQAAASYVNATTSIFSPDNEIEDLIDMSAFEDEGVSDRGATPVPSDFKQIKNIEVSKGNGLAEPFDENAFNGTPSSRPSTGSSHARNGSASISLTPSATPRKRRASEHEDHTELTPLFKRHSVRHSREILT